MDIKIIDTSFGFQEFDNRLTRTAHANIPQPGKPARHTVLQAEIRQNFDRAKSHASVKVFADNMTWTELLALETEEWLPLLPARWTTQETVDAESELAGLADKMIARACRILDY